MFEIYLFLCFFCFSFDSHSLSINENNYEVYFGDFDNDGNHNDIYFHEKDTFILIHGDIALPLLTASSGSFYIPEGDYNVVVSHRTKFELNDYPAATKGVDYFFEDKNGDGLLDLVVNRPNSSEVFYISGASENTPVIGGANQSELTFVHFDHLGSVIAETNASGSVLSTLHYEPFGKPMEDTNDDIGYAGHKFDKDIGLNYMFARYYDPEIGRFYGNDPVDALGHLGTQNGIQGFNRYAYANNNPYKYIDPNGKWVQVVVVIGSVTCKVTKCDKKAAEAAMTVAEEAIEVWSQTGADSPTRNRVKLRKKIRKKIEENQPTNADGQAVDPNTGKPLKPGEIDIGHKSGEEWRKRKKMHEEKGSTREEVIEEENNPDLYQLEDRHENRSRRHEDKE